MSLFSNDMRVANTATPSFAKEANVGQFGWTNADAANYNQLIQYVDECRKIWINLEEKIDYVESLLANVDNIDGQVKYIEVIANEMSKWRNEVITIRDQINTLYSEVQPMYRDFVVKYPEIVTMHGEVLDAQVAVLAAEKNVETLEAGTQEWYDKSKDLYDDLKEGQVYRGTWDPTTNAYPAHQGTNSVWDVILPTGTLEHNYGGFLWRSGDRLLYVVSAAAYQQLATGSGVASINGKVGAVTLGAADVGAAPDGFGLGTVGKSLSNLSADSTNGSGFYSVYQGTTETPYSSGGPSGSQLLNMEWGSAGATQLFSSYTSDRLHFRRKYQSVWQPWYELYHSGRKPTPSEIGSVATTGDTMTGNLALTPGNNARLIVNNNYIMGSNNAIILRDHGNGNVTLSGGANSAGVAGQLYLGYNAAQTGTAGFNTSGVRLEVPLSWKGASTIVNSAGKVPAEATEGLVATAGGTMSGPLYWVDNNKYVNSSGDSLYVASKLGRVYIEGNSTPIARVAGVDYNIYHQGFKPTAADVGALGDTGTQTLKGNLLITGASGSDPISVTQVFAPSDANAQGVSFYNSTDTSKRSWGVGAYARSSVFNYAYFGTGESPWSNGLKVYSDHSEFNHYIAVGGSITSNVTTGGEMIQLNYSAGVGGNIRAKEDGVNDWYVGRANASGDVAIYSNKHTCGIVLRADGVEFTKPPRLGSAGTVYVTQHASSTDLNTLDNSAMHGMYYQDANANATPARNYPIAEAGNLMVTGGAYGAMQEYTTFSTNRKFVRGKSGGGGWLAWNEIAGVKDHCSAYRITAQTIAVGSTGILVPGVFPSAQGITSSNGDFNILRTGTYKIEWGFSIEPTGANQNGVGSIWINGAKTYDALIYNYCPASGTAAGQATQMGTSNTTIIAKLNSGDKVSFRVQAVNSTSVRIYQAGYMTITQL